MVFGAGGFIGQAVCHELQYLGHDVSRVFHRTTDIPGAYCLELTDRLAVEETIRAATPDAIINCAGSVMPDKPLPTFDIYSGNIIRAIARNQTRLIGNIVIVGSAGSYGEPFALPVSESNPLRPNTSYTRAKCKEEKLALSLAAAHRLPVIVARCFNPIGASLPKRLMLPQVIASLELHKYDAGGKLLLPVRELYGSRDYLPVADAAKAIVSLATMPEPRHTVYNVGSGQETSNSQLLRIVLDEYGHNDVEPSDVVPQPQTPADSLMPYASQADIKRMLGTGWQPTGLNGLRAVIRSIRLGGAFVPVWSPNDSRNADGCQRKQGNRQAD